MAISPQVPSAPNDDLARHNLPPSAPSKIALRLIMAAASLLALGGVALFVEPGRRSQAPTPTPNALEVLAQVRAETIPAEDSQTGYGMAFNAAGYAALREWNESLKPLPQWADRYEAIDITLPCCGARHPFRDETQNCGCGHHQALYGVTKFLLNTGYSTESTQAEVNRWKAYMFPKEALQAEMERRALTDPAVKRALDELKEKGEC